MRRPFRYGEKWWGVDLDGTLSQYDGYMGPGNIGDPVWPMVERVKRWRAEGRNVAVFTARVAVPDPEVRVEEETAIRAWCLRHIGEELPVTCMKDIGMVELWDDRAVGVVKNTGLPTRPSAVLGEPPRGSPGGPAAAAALQPPPGIAAEGPPDPQDGPRGRGAEHGG